MEFNVYSGIILGAIFIALIIKYIFPILDILIELFTCKISEIATKSQLKSQAMVKEFEIKYPDISEQMPAIGFQCDAISEQELYEIDEDYIEDNSKLKNKIGFKP